jgi:hypothetical protein
MPSIVVEGRFISPTQIELSHPVQISEPTVEIEIRPRSIDKEKRRQDMLALLQRMAATPNRGRTLEDINQQIEEERASWDDRR